MSLIYLSLGSNLGNPEQHLDEALKLIQSQMGRIDRISRYYESEAWGFSSENRFCNCCLSLRSNTDPILLMHRLLEIEQVMGRSREGMGYSDRVIDIDMLLYGDLKLEHPQLTLPHPSMGDRRFVLAPLAEIAADLIHPVTGISIGRMFQECTDQSEVKPLNQK